AAVEHLRREFSELESIDIGISPGNRTERGLSTVQAILSYCGKPLQVASATPVFGWGGSWRHRYPAPVGARLLSHCDVPDLALFPAAFANGGPAPTVRFGAGLELEFLHRGMNLMAQLARIGIVANWSAHAFLLKRMADWFMHLGSDAGAMHVSVTGRSTEGTRGTRNWYLLATHGDGPYVPTLAAAALIRRLMRGDTGLVGARPCVRMLTLDEFRHEAQGLMIEMTEAFS
ncbi:MAG TPA: hypothetical protein VGE47_04575, partial [Burkholderiaceae bacterium]